MDYDVIEIGHIVPGSWKPESVQNIPIQNTNSNKNRSITATYIIPLSISMESVLLIGRTATSILKLPICPLIHNRHIVVVHDMPKPVGRQSCMNPGLPE